MQQTRRYILDILKERGEATVDDIVADLQKHREKQITAVTVRHHLTRLQEEHLIMSPNMRHRNTPGRPQHVYMLTDKAVAQFPNNYQNLAQALLKGLSSHIAEDGINVILEEAANHMAQDASIPNVPIEERLDLVVEYLNQHGYEAYWEVDAESRNYILHTCNCPYHNLAQDDHMLCEIDMRYVSILLGVVPRRLGHIIQGDETCCYMIPTHN